ncbi:hypothetical protein RSAG8_07442, partial [Rhizoctonia solani AG-8 WAC10335]
ITPQMSPARTLHRSLNYKIRSHEGVGKENLGTGFYLCSLINAPPTVWICFFLYRYVRKSPVPRARGFSLGAIRTCPPAPNPYDIALPAKPLVSVICITHDQVSFSGRAPHTCLLGDSTQRAPRHANASRTCAQRG